MWRSRTRASGLIGAALKVSPDIRRSAILASMRWNSPRNWRLSCAGQPCDLSTCGQFDERFEPPYSTIHIGKLNGGIALNVIPDYAELEFEIRNLPGDDPDRIMRAVHSYAERELVYAMREIAPETGIEWQRIG